MEGLLLSILHMDVKLDGQEGEGNSIHYYTDSLIKEILDKLLSHTTVATIASRNVADFSSSTIQGKRPDFQFYVNQFLILGGEEKSSKTQLVVARSGLIAKLRKWNEHIYGRLNYIFGFACAGEFLTFHAMSPSGNLANISDIFMLTSVEDRIKIIIFVINLARLFRTLVHRIPSGLHMLYQPIQRPNGGTIMIHYDYVMKTIPLDIVDLDTTYDYLHELYTAMQRDHVPHVIELVKMSMINLVSAGYIYLKLSPCGIQRIPQTKKEFLFAFKSILQALEGVHKLGYAHLDVRWANVLSVTDEDWRLIDFENSQRDIDSSLKSKDMQMLGEMMLHCNELMTPPDGLLRSLCNQLISDNPPDASTALTFLSKII